MPGRRAPRARARGCGHRRFRPAFLAAILFLCFLWPLHLPGSPADLRQHPRRQPAARSRPTTSSAPTKSATTTGRGSCTAAGPRSRSRSPSTRIGLFVGGLLGCVAGYLGGRRDAVIMRIFDVLIAFPALVLAIAIAERPRPRASSMRSGRSRSSACPALARLARAEPRCACASRPSSSPPACRAPGTCAHSCATSSPTSCRQLMTFALLGIGIVDRARGGAQLPRPRNPPADSQLGQHDRLRPDRAHGATEVRAASRARRCSSRCSRFNLLGGRPAGAVELAVSANGVAPPGRGRSRRGRARERRQRPNNSLLEVDGPARRLPPGRPRGARGRSPHLLGSRGLARSR